MKTVIFFFIILLLSPGFSFLVLAEVKSKGMGAKKVKYTSQDLRDPFKSPFEIEMESLGEPPPPPPEEQPPPKQILSYLQSRLEVQGIVWGSETPQAIINNVVLKVGEVIGGAEIIDIRKEGVYVLYEGRQYILRPVISKSK